MDPVVEDREVRLGRPAAGAEDEGDVGVIGGDPAGGLLVAERVAEDDGGLVLLGGLAQHALHVAGVADVVGERVVDAAGLLLGLEGGVDDAVPRLLDLGGEGAEDLRVIAVAAVAAARRAAPAAGAQQQQASSRPRASAEGPRWVGLDASNVQ